METTGAELLHILFITITKSIVICKNCDNHYYCDDYNFSDSANAGAIKACSLLEIPFALAIRRQFSLTIFLILAMVDLALLFETPKNSHVSWASSVEIVESFSVTLSERFSP